MQFEFFQLLLHYWAAGCLLILEEQRWQLEGRWGGGTSFTIKITTIHRHTQKHLWTHRRHFYSFLHDDFTVIALIAVYFICPSSFTARTRAASLSLLLSHLHTYISPKLKTKYTWWERHTHVVKNDKKKGESKGGGEKEKWGWMGWGLPRNWGQRWERRGKTEGLTNTHTCYKHASESHKHTQLVLLAHTLAWSSTQLHLARDAERCRESNRCELACELRSCRERQR